uniref:Ig-like domain-containing protein n=1 Tax=Stegastes partitus TaxID=144197 RepID=A0A3B4ZMP2_9TELE
MAPIRSPIHLHSCLLNMTQEFHAQNVIAAEGDTVTLNCTFVTSDRSPYLFWYKQKVNGYPKYMMKKLGSEPPYKAPEFQEDRFHTEIQDKSVPLKIQKLQLSDSAVYYCALRPTVTGNSKTLENSTTSTRGRHTLLHLYGLLGFSLHSASSLYEQQNSSRFILLLCLFTSCW